MYNLIKIKCLFYLFSFAYTNAKEKKDTTNIYPGRDHILVVGFTTTCSFSAYYH